MTLSPENQTALEDLLVAIEANGPRLGIFIAVCDDPQLKEEIIQRYEAELSPEFRHYRLAIGNDVEPNIKGMIAQQVQEDSALQPGVPAVMTILGSEQLFSLRLGQEKSQQEEFFGYLQWTREGLRSLPYAIVLWVTYQMQGRLGRRAPDFWSWRQDVVRFVSPRRSAIATDTFDQDSQFVLNLPEDVGETLPVADLEALIKDTEAKSPNSLLLASLYLQAGKAYAGRLKQGASQQYTEEIQKATYYLEKAASLTKKGEPNQEHVDSIAWLASLYRSQGSYEEAEPLYLKALEQSRKLLGEEHPNIAMSLNNLAELYRSQGRYKEAESLYLQDLKMSRKLLGEEHLSVASSLNNLANLYRKQGRYEEAEPLCLQALAQRRKVLGEEHPDVATSLNNLANLYGNQGRYGEVEPLYLQALAQRRKLLGEEHPSVASSLNNLANLYRNQGRYEDAEPLYLKALEIWRKYMGDEHPDVAMSLNNLANLYGSQGHYEGAEPLYLQALEIWRKALGDEHPDVAMSLNNLANLYESQSRYEEAEPLYLKALEQRRKLLGEDHPDVAMSLNNLGVLYYFQKSYTKAELFFLQSLGIQEKKLGLQHPSTVTSQKWLEATRSHLNPES